MPFAFRDREISKVGVVGSGQIGPDIALYFAKALASADVSVVVVDVAKEALDRGEARLHKKIDRGVASGAFTPEDGVSMKAAVTFTTDYRVFADADFVVEAATENATIKSKIFAQLESICSRTTILVSNSSHMEPEVIAESLSHRDRALVVHYFFPAERNYVVEVVPGAETAPEVADWVQDFYEAIGKVPVRVRSRYGYAVDPVFEGLFLAAALAAEAGLGTTQEIDSVATRALGLTVGPFTAMNLTGGNPITAHGLVVEGEKIMPWFRTPKSLSARVASGEPWEVPGRGEKLSISPDKEAAITEELQGAYFGLCDEILSSGIIGLADFELALEMALDITPPVRLAEKIGWDRALVLAANYAQRNEGFRKPTWLAAHKNAPEVPVVLRKDRGNVAILLIRRPKSLNSLNDAAFSQLRAHFEKIRAERSIDAVVLTGFGVKAFVSGADVRFLARIDSPETGMADSKKAQALTRVIENLGKPVVAALNGLAFGGGLEIAMACTTRIARRGLKVLGGQPEVNLGIIPGAGGSQRLPRLVGISRGAELLRTGRPISGSEALEIGLIMEEVEPDLLVGRAVELAGQLAVGTATIHQMPQGPLEGVPEKLRDVDIKHRSKAVDAILQRAILDGARTDLDRGLAIENACFGDVCRTEDMKIGIATFLEKGPREKAPFVHR